MPALEKSAPTRSVRKPGSFPNRISEFRTSNFPGMTQEKLGTLLNVRQHPVRVNRDERGRNDLKQSRIAAYAKALGVRPYELLLEPEDVQALEAAHRILAALKAGGISTSDEEAVDDLIGRIVRKRGV